MLKYVNLTEKQDFIRECDFFDRKIVSIPTKYSCSKAWEVTDNCMNKWEIKFNGNVSEFIVSNSESAYVCSLILCGDNITIVNALENRRHIKSDRYLKKYADIALMVSNYFRFGFLK